MPEAAGGQPVAGAETHTTTATPVYSVMCKGHKYMFSSDIVPKDDAMHVVKATDLLSNILELTFKNKKCVSVEIVK